MDVLRSYRSEAAWAPVTFITDCTAGLAAMPAITIESNIGKPLL